MRPSPKEPRWSPARLLEVVIGARPSGPIAGWLSRLEVSLRNYARHCAALERADPADTQALWEAHGFAYRLHAWPDLAPACRTAVNYRTLSIMTTQAVSVAWFSRRSGLSMDKAQEILNWLVEHRYADEIPLDDPQSAVRLGQQSAM